MQISTLPVYLHKVTFNLGKLEAPRPSYALPQGEIKRLHYHEYCEVGICLKGHGLWVSDRKAYALSPGDTVFVPSYTPHYSRSIGEDCLCKFFYFDEEQLLKNNGIAPFRPTSGQTMDCPLVIKQRTHSSLHLILEQLMNATEQTCALSTKIKKIAHWYSLLLLELPTSGNDIQYNCNDLLPALERVAVDFAEPLTLEMLAAACKLSPNWFIKRFKKEFGLSPIKYLNVFRCEVAAQLLADNVHKITDISAFVGFSAPSDLYRHFKAVYGISPADYRKQL